MKPRRGPPRIVVLAFLEDEPRHGYELTQLIEERSGGALTFNFASLYATLYKLEERGWIQGRWVERAGQRRRRYYRITTEGRTVLAAQRQRVESVLRADSGSRRRPLCVIAPCGNGKRWFASVPTKSGASSRSM